MEKKRPSEVAVMGLLTVLLALANIVGFLIQYSFVYTPMKMQREKILILSALVQFLYICVLIISGYGLLKLKEWARVTAIFLLVPLLLFVAPVIEYLRGFSQPFWVHIVRIVFSAAFLIIFTRPKIKEQFR